LFVISMNFLKSLLFFRNGKNQAQRRRFLSFRKNSKTFRPFVAHNEQQQPPVPSLCVGVFVRLPLRRGCLCVGKKGGMVGLLDVMPFFFHWILPDFHSPIFCR
jgi:hypothetical protein